MNDNNNKPVKPWDLLKPTTHYVSDDIAKQRYDLCKSCPEFIKLTAQCKKCGCLMKIKTTMSMAFCPIGKWGIENVEL